MADTVTNGAPIPILEWRHEGHRLGYVAAVAEAAHASGRQVDLRTTRPAVESDEFATHLGGLDIGVTVVRAPASLRDVGSLIAAVGLDSGIGPVVPEVDEHLPALLQLAAQRRLPPLTQGIVMRPPGSHGRSRRRPRALLKHGLIAATARLPNLHLHLLEDPLAHGDEQVWPPSLLSSASRLDDPCDLYDVSGASDLPSELRERDPNRPFLAVVGAIDDRKRIPLLLESWHAAYLSDRADLVIAGRHQPEIARIVDEAGADDGSIITIDRYVSNVELGSICSQASGLVALYDVGTSSGLLSTAGGAGRWVVAIEGSRTERVASSNGFGVSCEHTPAGVAAGMRQVVERRDHPDPIDLPTAREFGMCLIADHLRS